MVEEDRVLYTDGRDVTVTDTKLQVKNQEYNLNGVTKCGLMTLSPTRAPGIILLVFGLLLVIAGLMNVIAPTIVPDVKIGQQYIDANTLALWIGGALALIGILAIGLSRERYAVRIATAEGEKDALISSKREYIAQIVDALNQAASYVRARSSGTDYFKINPA